MKLEDQYLKEALGFFASQQYSSSGIYARKVIRKNSNNVEALALLAKLAMRQNDNSEAHKFYSQLLTLSPQNAEAIAGLAQVAENREQFFDAFNFYQKLAILEPENTNTYFKLGMAALQNGNIDIAESALTRCVEREYTNKACLLNLGHVYKAKGDTDKAAELYHDFIEQSPEHQSTGYWSLADLKSYILSLQDRNNIEVYLAATNISSPSRALMLFALSRYWEQQKDFAKAYAAMNQANNLLSPSRPFKEEAFLGLINRLKSFEAVDNSLQQEQHVFTPIFIVGMPRSGTTLAEQILASHKKVQATDELPYIERLALQLEMSGGYSTKLQSLSVENIQKLRQDYLNAVKPYLEGSPDFFIDKNPNNFLHIGLIKVLFPEAKIINLIRHTTDNAISVYKQHFSRGHDYSYNLRDIEVYWNGYYEIMQHWDRLYGSELYHISFETLVKEPETQIRDLLEYCNLSFSQDCIDFHKSTRTVLTPSAAQVRRPMNVKAIGMRDKYRDVLGKDYQIFEDIAVKVNEYFFQP